MLGSSARMRSDFTFVQSCDLDANIQIKICTMEGSLPQLEFAELLQNPFLQYSGRKQSKVPDFLVEAVILGSQNTQLHLPVATSYKCFHRRWEWNEWLKLPLKYSDLPRNAVLSLSLFDCVRGHCQKLAKLRSAYLAKKESIEKDKLTYKWCLIKPMRKKLKGAIVLIKVQIVMGLALENNQWMLTD